MKYLPVQPQLFCLTEYTVVSATGCYALLLHGHHQSIWFLHASNRLSSATYRSNEIKVAVNKIEIIDQCVQQTIKIKTWYEDIFTLFSH